MCLMNLASKPGLHKTAHHSVAQAVASLVVTQPVSEAFTLVQNFLQEAQRPHSDWQHIFALLCMGEIGKRMDLHQVPGLGQAIIDSFGPPNEEVFLIFSNVNINLYPFSLGKICSFARPWFSGSGKSSSFLALHSYSD